MARGRKRPPLPIPTEKAVQQRVKVLLKSVGCAVYDTSQPFRAAITPGVPDLICFHPTKGLFFMECKRPGARPTPAQTEFAELCEKAAVPYLLGGTTEAAEFVGVIWR